MTKEQDFIKDLAYNETFNCVQCGYCLPTCPTYVSFGKETHSPRGRINLVKMAAEGKISLDDLADPIDLCLGCRACETVCPTNVEYGKILTSAVNALSDHRRAKRSKKEKLLRKLAFQYALPNKKVLKLAGKGLYVFQKTKMNNVVRKTNILPQSLEQMEKVTPEVKLPLKRNSEVANKTSTYKIGFFTGCIMDTFFANINDLSIKLLETGGCEVTTIKEQTCCGALQHHAGEENRAVALAKKNIVAFEKYEFDFIVNAIGGCGAALVEYPLYFKPDDPWYKRATTFAEKCKDISVILTKLDLVFSQRIEKVTTYQPSCHLTNVQHVVDPPLELLKKIEGIYYIPLPQKDMCCGSAGIYNIIHHQESMLVLDDKMKNITAIIPELIVTTNPGCHLQMLLGVEQNGLTDKIQVVHLVELLAEACEIS
ncbi:glycolate oxidase [Sporosarcina sp. P26b]|uniref:(Fe-S)-binding protein n=1 Tax=Sporosarcina sp. P26b TaxID=2048253 RepID=UPI000C16F4A6|nr:(Fe-S)-binding protein [Sporosarcina sp. P26b]PIC94599.1 glycolate oxidase [Sporosarcina sp. P26b]